MIRKLWSIIRWWFRCLWTGKIVPRKEKKLFSRSYMRKIWRDRLQSLDRQVNDAELIWQHGIGKEKYDSILTIQWLLSERRIMVAKRRKYLHE